MEKPQIKTIPFTTYLYYAKCKKLFSEGWKVNRTLYDCIELYK